VFGVQSLDEVRGRQADDARADRRQDHLPAWIVHGENDRQIPPARREDIRFAAVNSLGCELKIFHLADGGAEHCGADNNGLIVDYIATGRRKAGASPG
jgi:dienelactone hydrolase